MQRKRRGQAAWLLGCLTLSGLVGSIPAKGAGAASCPDGEYVEMLDPVVTVIDGPGDPASEQTRLLLLKYSQLEGPLTMVLGDTTFDLERVP